MNRSQISHFKYLRNVNLQRNRATFIYWLQLWLWEDKNTENLFLWHQHVYLANIAADLWDLIDLETCQLLCCSRYELLPGLEFRTRDTRRTDGQTDIQKAMQKSPTCISTGVLKKQMHLTCKWDFLCPQILDNNRSWPDMVLDKGGGFGHFCSVIFSCSFISEDIVNIYFDTCYPQMAVFIKFIIPPSAIRYLC